MLRFVLIIFVALCGLTRMAWADNIALIISDDSAPYQEFANSLKSRLLGSKWQVSYTDKKLHSLEHYPVDLIVTAGSEALRLVLDRGGRTPVLATLLPETTYNALLKSANRPPPVSAIVLDQPAERQARLLRLLFPKQQRVGILVSDQSINQANTFRPRFAGQGFQIITEHASNEQQVVPALESLLPKTDLLLAVPDSLLYSRTSIKPVLITAYRFKRPVIAFSAALTRAGALAALYSTPAQIGRQAADVINARGARLAPPLRPTEFSVSINKSVADSFGLNLPDEAELLQKLSSGTGES
jgi:putative tryptophan/tyrosine transport system substrate-binding protein